LLCWDDRQQLAWKQPLAYGPVAGAAAKGNRIVMSSTEGVVWTVAAETGQETGKISTHEFLAGDPVLVGKRCLVAGRDGCLHLLDLSE
jgi:hypothetical protein